MNKLVAQQKAQIVITSKLASRINLLHNQCPNGAEWSGLLVFKVLKGGIDDVANMEISCEDVYPMDFGDSTFTSFEGSEDWLDFFDQFPQVNPLTKEPGWYLGKIHSHHGMPAFHSGTDTQDLYDNAPKLPFFLSLVVNYACLPFAEIAVEAEGEEKEVKRIKWNLKNWKQVGNSKISKASKKVPTTLVIPCDVVYEEDAWFIDRLAELSKKRKPVHTYGKFEKFNSSVEKSWKPNQEKDTAKPTGALANPKNMNLLLAGLPELLTLETWEAESPFAALKEVSIAVPMEKREHYKKAFKQYFDAYWYWNTFGASTVSKLDAVTGIQNFADYHPHLWIHKPLTEALNELKEEFRLL